MEYCSELEIICKDLEDAVTGGNALLTKLIKSHSCNDPAPEFVHMSCVMLSEKYAAIDNNLKILLSGISQIDPNSDLRTEVHKFHECNETMQRLMSSMSSAYKLYEEHGDYAAMLTCQEAFCEHYPDILSVTGSLRVTITVLLEERRESVVTEMSCVYASPEIMESRDRTRRNTRYPFNHAEAEDELNMEVVYGAPQIMSRVNTGNEKAEFYIDPDETVRSCPHCDRLISASLLICPHCGFIIFV